MIKINTIQKMKIENVKGKDVFEINFNGLHSNFPNLLVAPNGYGKSTIATIFSALKPNKIELEKDDIFQGDENNKPSLKIDFNLSGREINTLVADESKNEFNPLINTYVIKTPVYAKSTSRNFGGRSTPSAKLDVRNLEIYKNVPTKIEVIYSIREFREKFDGKAKVFSNIADVFKSVKNLVILSDNYVLINKCAAQKGIQKIIDNFFEKISSEGSSAFLKNSITSDSITVIKENRLLFELLNIIKGLENISYGEGIDCEKDLILNTIQIIEVIKDIKNDIKKAKDYLTYVKFREDIDYKLEMFNTTGRVIKTKQTGNKLVIEFLSANKMSNGERDVLSFISNLSKFKVNFTKTIGILIIDEIFDYLDGSNMLIVQYYLSKLIEESKNEQKILFPIILTHLDPILFNNYYFKRPKIHYLKNYSDNSDTTMLEFLKTRNDDSLLAEKIESYYLHYNPEFIELDESEKALISSKDYSSSDFFYGVIQNELEKFLNDEQTYDPLKVICAIRVKIEKIVYDKLETEAQKSTFIETHKTINKLNYALDQEVSIQEEFFLLQPLFNDGLHMNNNSNQNKNKIQSVCLKLDNIIVQKIVGQINRNSTSNLSVTYA